MSEPPTLGIIGCGSVMQNAYMPLVRSLQSQRSVGEVVACDTSSERVERAAARFEIARTTTDAADVLDAPNVDIVVILTSMDEHGPLARAALLAGKHVLVEKPMAVDLDQAAELVELARESGRHLVCAPHVLLSPDYQAMQQRILDGAIGRPLLARARYGWDGPDWGAWFYQAGGGPLFDLGVYNVTTLTGLLGPARRVTAMSGITRAERVVDGAPIRVEADDTYQILIELHDGVFATVTTAFGMQRYRGPAVEIYGLQGTIQMLGDDWAPDGLELWRNDVGAWQDYPSASRYWPWTDGLRHLVDCVRDGTTPLTTPEHAYHVLEIMIRAMAAARTGRTQDVLSTFVPPRPLPVTGRGPAHRIHDRTHEDSI